MAAKRLTPAMKEYKRIAAQSDKDRPIAMFCRRIREGFGLSQAKFAAKVGSPELAVARTELGFYAEPREYIKKLWPWLRDDEKQEAIAILTESLVAELESE